MDLVLHFENRILEVYDIRYTYDISIPLAKNPLSNGYVYRYNIIINNSNIIIPVNVITRRSQSSSPLSTTVHIYGMSKVAPNGIF